MGLKETYWMADKPKPKKRPIDYSVSREIKKYTVWVGGTEVTDHFVTYTSAKLLYDNYEGQGYKDIIIKER
jgi:hypothetical protein|tara:strand:- start:157 stop:369 length:213 start_codon:yes stop_codon:yes gene_type:complete